MQSTECETCLPEVYIRRSAHVDMITLKTFPETSLGNFSLSVLYECDCLPLPDRGKL
jgi:hypothetical protein